MEGWDEEGFEAPGGEDEGVDFTGSLEAAGDIEEELVGEAEEGHWEGMVQDWTWRGDDVIVARCTAKASRAIGYHSAWTCR